jgi:hypothetical protein
MAWSQGMSQYLFCFYMQLWVKAVNWAEALTSLMAKVCVFSERTT